MSSRRRRRSGRSRDRDDPEGRQHSSDADEERTTDGSRLEGQTISKRPSLSYLRSLFHAD